MHVRCELHYDGTAYHVREGSTPGVSAVRSGSGEIRVSLPEPLPPFVDVFGAELLSIAPDRRSLLVRRLGRRGVVAEDGDLVLEVVEGAFLSEAQVALLGMARGH